MPVHRVPRDDIDATTTRLERLGEHIGSVISDGPDHLLVFTTVDTRHETRSHGYPYDTTGVDVEVEQ